MLSTSSLIPKNSVRKENSYVFIPLQMEAFFMAQLMANLQVLGSMYVNYLKPIVLLRPMFFWFCSFIVLSVKKRREVLNNSNDIELTGLNKRNEREEDVRIEMSPIKKY